ncbi:MAG: YadA C-terminal domain-containing protein [Desulfobacterales bacterium]|nr:YadA C-terminal domain-containing protein [Desulfobacterales bacterium]
MAVLVDLGGGTTTVSTGVSAATANGLNTGGAGGATAVGNGSGATTVTGSTVGINGATTITGTETVSGLATLNGGATVTGATSINATGGATTNIATAAAATTNIGVGGGTNNLLGTTGINDNTNNTTSINSGSSTSAVTIGNSANTTHLNSATNNIGTSATFATVNNIGTNAAFASTNIVGSTNVGSTVNAVGGNSALSVTNGTASLTSGTSGLTTTAVANVVGTSGPALVNGNAASQALVTSATYVNRLQGNTLIDGNTYINGTLVYSSNTSASTTVTDSVTGTSGAMIVVNPGEVGKVVDANGKITSGTATQSSASLTVTNPQGNTHGIVIAESKTTISGGTNSSSLTLNDNGATFSNSANGSPIQVHGVADGTNDYDAVNFRQMKDAYSGIAAVSALAAIPSPAVGKKLSVGMGYGNFKEENAVAVGIKAAVTESIMLTGGLGYGRDATVSVGVGYSW